jgi:hypothetical protein
MANETVISRETAAAQIKQLLDYYEFDMETFPDALRNALTFAIKQIEGGIMRGRLEVESTADNCIVKQHLKSPVPGAPNPIVYKEVSGKAKIGIRDDSSNYGKIYAFLGALSTEGAAVFQSMKGKDLSLAEALGSLFLQV